MDVDVRCHGQNVKLMNRRFDPSINQIHFCPAYYPLKTMHNQVNRPHHFLTSGHSFVTSIIRAWEALIVEGSSLYIQETMIYRLVTLLSINTSLYRYLLFKVSCSKVSLSRRISERPPFCAIEPHTIAHSGFFFHAFFLPFG